ncbi:MAG: MMPL family transporter [Planctomycetales bacterium]|nr:MMPL family transporter [Planctomycetales bacterium]
MKLLIKHRYLLFAVGIACGLLSQLSSQRLQFDRSIENMFTSDDGVLAPYRQLKNAFGGNEIVLAVYTDAELFAPSGIGIDRVRKIQKRLASVPGVKAVLSIDQPLPGNAIVQDNFISQRTRRLFQGYTHGADQETVAIACMLHPEQETTVDRRQTIASLRAVIQDLPDGLPDGHLTGEPVLVVDGFRYVEQDGERLGKWSAILLGGTIILCFRSIRWVIIPIAVVQLSIMMTRGVLRLTGMQLSMVSSMLVAVVMVIAVATMVHVIVRFLESRLSGLSTRESLERTVSLLIAPIFWSCVTDAVGFLSLTTSDVGPVQDFGVMMSIGAGMVLLSVALIVPAAALLGTVDSDPKIPWGQQQLNERLSESVAVIQRYPKQILLLIAVVAAIGLSGLPKTEIETDFTKNFRSNSEIVIAYNLVEDKLGGAGVCDIMFAAPKQLTWNYLKQVRELTADIDKVLQANATSDSERQPAKALSLSDAVATLTNIERQPAMLRESLCGVTLVAMRKAMPEFFAALHGKLPNSDQYYLRVMLRLSEQQSSSQKKEVIAKLKSVSQKHFPDAEVTGYFVLLSNLIDSVLRDQWRTFGTAVVAIGLLMWIAFRNLRLALIALVPNLLPILIVLGMMGWLRVLAFPELKINIGAAMIAAVSMGLSIDSSIHYIISFQRARREKDFGDALIQVQRNVGRAMVLSTISLIVGFTVLATSQFVPTVYFGTLVSLAMLGGLLGNLVVLPALLSIFVAN